MEIEHWTTEFLPGGSFKLSELIIKQERTACFGDCPIYKLQIFGTGEVIYEGIEFVKTKGIVKYSVAPETVFFLFLMADDCAFFNMDDAFYENHNFDLKDGIVYDNHGMVTDLPSAITTISIGNKSKTVDNYDGAPKKLYKFQKEIDKAVNVKQFIK